MSTQSLRGGAAAGRGERWSASALPTAAAAGSTSAATTPSGGAATSGGAAQLRPPQRASVRPCGLPSCGLKEAAPLDFRVCALCNAVAYCCEAHSAAHWRAGHKRECAGRTRAVAQLPRASDGAGSASTPPGGAVSADGGAESALPSTGAVAHPPPLPPSPQDVATLRALVEKFAEKVVLKRQGRAAEVCGQAADLAFRMVRTPLVDTCLNYLSGPTLQYGSDSLIGASLRLHESSSVQNEAVLEPDPGVKTSLISRMFGLLITAVGVIEQRMAAGTLLPGACREVELQFEAHFETALRKVKNEPPFSAADRRATSATVGYAAALHAAYLMLITVHNGWSAAQRLRCRSQAFVLAALDTIPHTATLTYRPGAELVLVNFMEQDFERVCSLCDTSLASAVKARWTSPAVVNVLRARGSLQTGVVYAQQLVSALEARRKEDVAARGFRRCGLPSCGKLETTVRHFKLCTGCDAVAYCCDGHFDAHWREGHRRKCRHLRAAGARPPSTLDD